MASSLRSSSRKSAVPSVERSRVIRYAIANARCALSHSRSRFVESSRPRAPSKRHSLKTCVPVTVSSQSVRRCPVIHNTARAPRCTVCTRDDPGAQVAAYTHREFDIADCHAVARLIAVSDFPSLPVALVIMIVLA